MKSIKKQSDVMKETDEKHEVYRQITNFIHDPESNVFNSLEEVEEDVWYSKTVRVLCVLDEDFDKKVDEDLRFFLGDCDQDSYYQDFETPYAVVRIQKDADGKITVFCWDEEYAAFPL